MTAISSAGGLSQPSTRTWINPVAMIAAIGQLFTTSQASETEAVLRRPRPPKRYASYYESGIAGRERFRL